MKYWGSESLQVNENGHYLVNGNPPYFWLGDIAWLLLQQCADNVERYWQACDDRRYAYWSVFHGAAGQRQSIGVRADHETYNI